MKTPGKSAFGRRQARLTIALAASLFVCAGCNNASRARMTPLDTAGMHPETIEQLNKYQVNDAEVQQILTVGRAGMSEQECVELVRLARSRDRSFAEGDAIAGTRWPMVCLLPRSSRSRCRSYRPRQNYPGSARTTIAASCSGKPVACRQARRRT